MSTRLPHRLILRNDGNAIAGPTREAPLGERGLVELAIDPSRDILVDTLYWQLETDPPAVRDCKLVLAGRRLAAAPRR